MADSLPVFGQLNIAALYLIMPMDDKQFVVGKRFYPSGVQLIAVKDCKSGTWNWKISDGSSVLTKRGEWIYEPMSTHRDAIFLAQTRWGSLTKAVELWMRYSKREGIGDDSFHATD